MTESNLKQSEMLQIIELALRISDLKVSDKELEDNVNLFKHYILEDTTKHSSRLDILNMIFRCKGYKQASDIIKLAKRIEICYFKENSEEKSFVNKVKRQDKDTDDRKKISKKSLKSLESKSKK